MAEVTFTLPTGERCDLEIVPGADHALAPFPCCDRYEDGRVYPKTRVRLVERRHDHDTYYCDTIALCCGKRLGESRVVVSTVFGIDEDRAFFRDCRARVYS